MEEVMFKIFNSNRNMYLVHKAGEGNFKVCKVLNEYKDVETAHEALTALITDEKTERDLLREFSK